MWKDYYSVTSSDEAIKILSEQGSKARIIAGATDLMLEMERGVRKGIDTLIDISRISGLNKIRVDEDDIIRMGPLVTHADCIASIIIVERAFLLARACWEVGAPQIRNRGTVAGNIITASPANDTIPPLIALNASVVLQSIHGTREVPLDKFYNGVRRNIMQPDEMLVEIKFPALNKDQCGTFYKLGLRRAQAISLVNCAVILTFDGLYVTNASITLGAIAPIIVHAKEAEEFIRNKVLSDDVIENAAQLSRSAAKPIDDIRSTRDYRLEMVRVCVKRILSTLQRHEEKNNYHRRPILLRRNSVEQPDIAVGLRKSVHHNSGNSNQVIETVINGRNYRFLNGFNKSLLRLFREEAGLIGTKEGCAEGECGACTVFLDGMAVMSCMVPAVRAHGSEIVTIEGIEKDEKLHRVQQAFIDQAAVQCGYCTPGFIMSSVMLLQEVNKPNREQIKEAISGNLCRCTGYYSIVAAIEQAAEQ